MEIMYVELKNFTPDGPIRIGSGFGEISITRAIEIAKCIIDSQTSKAPISAEFIGQWNELMGGVNKNLDELSKFTKKMETLYKLEDCIQEKKAKAQKLEKELEKLQAEIQQVQHEQEAQKKALKEN